MQAVFRALYSEIRGLHQSAYILAFFSFASQLLALIRDRLFAHQFGAGTELDVYYAAFKIPDLLFVLFASVLSVYVLIPFISERTGRDDVEGARELLSTVYTAFVGAYVVVALCVALFASSIASFLFPGFHGEAHTTLVLLMRLLLLQPLLLGASSLLSVITQLEQRFVLYALSPLLYNFGIIFGAIVLYPYVGLSGIVYGVIIGAFLHCVVQIPLVRQSVYAPKLLRRLDFRLLGTVLMQSTPRALTLSLSQIVLLAFAGIASSMAAGSVSIFQFAFNLQSVPLSIIGVSYSVAAFPMLAQLYAKGEYATFVYRVETTLRHLIFWIFPIIGFTIVLRAQIVRVVLGSGAFDWNATRLTAAALSIFALSLLAQSVNLLIVRAFYAGGNTRTPFRTTVISTISTLVLTLILFVSYEASPTFAHLLGSFFRVEGLKGAEVLMLPLGYAIVESLRGIYLLLTFAREFGLRRRPVFATGVRGLLAALGGSFVSYIILNTVVGGLRTETFTGVFLQGLLSGMGGLLMVVYLLYMMQSPELHELWGAMRRWPLVVRLLGPDSLDTLAL